MSCSTVFTYCGIVRSEYTITPEPFVSSCSEELQNEQEAVLDHDSILSPGQATISNHGDQRLFVCCSVSRGSCGPSPKDARGYGTARRAFGIDSQSETVERGVNKSRPSEAV